MIQNFKKKLFHFGKKLVEHPFSLSAFAFGLSFNTCFDEETNISGKILARSTVSALFIAIAAKGIEYVYKEYSAKDSKPQPQKYFNNVVAFPKACKRV